MFTHDDQPDDKNHDQTEDYDGPPVSKPTKDELKHFAPFLADDYKDFKVDFIDYLNDEGKDPDANKGFSRQTVKGTHYRIEQVFRWLWDEEKEYTSDLTPEQATELIRFVHNRTPHPDSVAYHYVKAIRRLFDYYRNRRREQIEEWEHDVDLTDTNSTKSNHQKDRLYPKEFRDIYQAALEYSSVKSYNNKTMTKKEREQLKIFISRRLSIPKDEIGPEEFNKASSWKVPSLIAVTCDTGLRPIEVKRAKVDWFNLDRQKMIIPKDQSSKNSERWRCALQNRAVSALKKWFDERSSLEKYQGTDSVWLTKYGSGYKSGSLNPILQDLMDKAGIDQRGRDLSWYSIRHGVATVWAEDKGIYKAKNQMRHKSIETTLRYTRNSGDTLTEEVNSVW